MLSDQTLTLLLSFATLAVSAVALILSLMVFLVERVRRQVTPNWTPSRNRAGLYDLDPEFSKVRDQGSIYAVGEGSMEGAVLDVVHGHLKPVEFPRHFSSRDGKIDYSFVASRADIEAGLEPVIGLFWWGPGILGRKHYGIRLFAKSLRYEKYARSITRPWKHVWKPTGVPAVTLRKMTVLAPATDRAWLRHNRKHGNS